MTASKLRRALEALRGEFLRNARIERDPLHLVLRYERAEDREVAGILAALLAYGRVDSLMLHTEKLLSCLGERPAEAIRFGPPRLPHLAYRFHRTRDLTALLRGIRTLLLRHGSLGRAFARHWKRKRELRAALSGFAHELARAASPGGPGLRFLLADPDLGGACKRWHLFLRWMVRHGPDDPDTGVWREILPASELLVPLDAHLVRVARRLGLTNRRTVGWKMAEEVTRSLRALCPEDPVRFDFALCHLGMTGRCPPRLKREDCDRCVLLPVCPTGRARAAS